MAVEVGRLLQPTDSSLQNLPVEMLPEKKKKILIIWHIKVRAIKQEKFHNEIPIRYNM